MDKRSIREDASLYFLPIILGNDRPSHSLSMRIFLKYGISSILLDEKHSVLDAIDFSSRSELLSHFDSSALLCEQLIALAEQRPYTLPILIPCSEEYKKAVEEQKESLESFFVISTPETVLLSSPLTAIP